MFYLYVNETKDETIEEEIEFQLTGLEIEGKPGETKLEIVVRPPATYRKIHAARAHGHNSRICPRLHEHGFFQRIRKSFLI